MRKLVAIAALVLSLAGCRGFLQWRYHDRVEVDQRREYPDNRHWPSQGQGDHWIDRR